MLNFTIPNLQTPFLNRDGTISREWFLFLSSLLQTVGGPAVTVGGVGIPPIEIQQQFEEYPLTVPDAVEALRGIDELRNLVYPQSTQVAELVAAIDELRNATHLKSPKIDEMTGVIDELRNELAYSKNEVQQLRGVIDDLVSASSVSNPLNDLRNRVELIEDRLA